MADDVMGAMGGGQSLINIADAIRQQATAQKKKALGVDQQVDPVAALMQQLQSQLNGVSADMYMSPLEQLRRQAQTSVSAQYDPQITALRSEMSRTQNRGNRNKKDVRAMYQALAQDIAAERPGINKEMDAAQVDVANQYNTAKAGIGQNYDKAQAEQNAIMKQLGIQAAMPDASAEANVDEEYFKNMTMQDSRQLQGAMEQIQQGAVQYNQQSANNSSLAGVNAASDIQAQLEDYLQQAGGQMSALTSGKEAGIAAALAQLQAADSQRAEQLAQQAQSQIMQLANFQLAAQSKLDKQSEAEGPFKGTTGLSGATNFLAQKYPDQPTRATALSSILGQVLSLPELQSGRQVIKNPTTNMEENVPITEEWVMQKIREAGEGQGFGQADLNNVMDAYLATIGKLR